MLVVANSNLNIFNQACIRKIMAMEGTVNTVRYLQFKNFSQLTMKKELDIKTKGRHTPPLCIRQISTSKSWKVLFDAEKDKNISAEYHDVWKTVCSYYGINWRCHDFNDKVTTHFATSKTEERI